ncbi:MAG: hypothetical protein JWN46_3523 [Acidimicrobiales bacterium]|nr:hypothetical protein [Acidimicrobiales bacterium]
MNYTAPGPTNGFAGSTWGGNKVLWAVAPRTGTATVRGHEVGGSGKVRFGLARNPTLELVLPAPRGAVEWSGFPSMTRVQRPGCYAFEVTSGPTTETITFRFV